MHQDDHRSWAPDQLGRDILESESGTPLSDTKECFGKYKTVWQSGRAFPGGERSVPGLQSRILGYHCSNFFLESAVKGPCAAPRLRWRADAWARRASLPPTTPWHNCSRSSRRGGEIERRGRTLRWEGPIRYLVMSRGRGRLAPRAPRVLAEFAAVAGIEVEEAKVSSWSDPSVIPENAFTTSDGFRGHIERVRGDDVDDAPTSWRPGEGALT